MAAIAIHDLSTRRPLDPQAMNAVRGGGAPWVFGWIRPFVPAGQGPRPTLNFFQINNFHADQMINQFQLVDVRNTAPGASINVALDEQASNFGQVSPLPA